MKVYSMLVSFLACLGTVSPVALESSFLKDAAGLEELPPAMSEIQISNLTANIPDMCKPYVQRCPTWTVQVNNLCYRYVQSSKTWLDAKKDCEAQGGFLAKPDFTYNNTALDLSLIYRDIIGRTNIWIGATDMDPTELWKWVDGSELDIKNPNWFPGHPGTYGESCALIHQMKQGPLQVRKGKCHNKRYFLCQFKQARIQKINLGGADVKIHKLVNQWIVKAFPCLKSVPADMVHTLRRWARGGDVIKQPIHMTHPTMTVMVGDRNLLNVLLERTNL